MKVLKNKTTEIDVSTDSNDKVTFIHLAKACINNVPKNGLDVVEMQGRLDVMKKINQANGELSLENAEADVLKQCTKDMRWLIMHDDVIEFIDKVDKM